MITLGLYVLVRDKIWQNCEAFLSSNYELRNFVTPKIAAVVGKVWMKVFCIPHSFFLTKLDALILPIMLLFQSTNIRRRKIMFNVYT